MATQTPATQISSIGTHTDGTPKVHFDPYNAVAEFVTTPIADRFGLTGEEVEESFEVDAIFRSVTEYGRIDGREGHRLRGDMTDERYWATVELGRL